jgi:dienelactone hydrolase
MKQRTGLKITLTSLAVMLVGLSGMAVSHASGWSVPKRTLAEQVALIRPYTDIRLPSGASGPLPTLILFHGCGGLRDVQEDYSAATLEAGYAVMIIGSNQARGIGRFGAMSQVCTAMRLWGQERSADVHAALEIARQDPRLDAEQIALVGWSHGGWTVLDALGYAGDGQLPAALKDGRASLAPQVRTAIVIYPYCAFPVRTDGSNLDPGIPVRSILAGRDMVAPHGACERLFDRALAAGVDVEYSVWPDITHAFDEPNQPNDPRMEYDAEAAHRARAYLIELLDETFSQG